MTSIHFHKIEERTSEIMGRQINYKIQTEDTGQTIASFLKEHRYSKQNLSELKWKDGSIRLNHQNVKMHQKLCAGDLLTVYLEEQKTSDQIKPVELSFPIVYEDEDLLVIDKPAGMPSQPSWYYEECSLANAAAFYWKQHGWPFVYRCVNRLDKDTSGLLILAKHSVAGAILNSMHQTGELRRTYYAIVDGIGLPEDGVIETPIAKDETCANRYQVNFTNGKYAKTHFKRLWEKNGKSMVELWLETGRTHQIRVHMSSIGYPLVGDPTYNENKDDKVNRQALHAGKLEFVHPMTVERMKFSSELPEDMRVFER